MPSQKPKPKPKPKYLKIYDEIRQDIYTGKLRPGDRLPTEAKLAKKYEVSVITSKRALEELEHSGLIYRIQGSGSFISGDTIKDFSKSGKLKDIIALVLPFNSVYGKGIEVINGIESIIKVSGLYLSIHNSHYDDNLEKEIISQLVNDGVRGIILYPVSAGQASLHFLNLLNLNNYPIVIIDKYFDSIDMNYVISDNLNGSYLMTEYLFKIGHKNIAFISDINVFSRSSTRDRYMGYCKAHRDHNIPLTPNNFNIGFMDSIEDANLKNELLNESISENGILFFRKLLFEIKKNNPNITAIQAITDKVALNIVKAALGEGINVPSELSAVGFDNIENLDHFEVPLTTVMQDFFNMGKAAGELVLKKIKNPRVKSQKILIPTKLIKRKSIAQPENGILNEEVI